MSQKVNISKEQLNKLYEKEKLTTYQIANKLGCCQATIWKKLIEFGIRRRAPHELNSNVPSKNELIRFYINKKLSTWEIEKKYGYCRGTIHRKLKEFRIKTRDRADSHIIYKRTNFSENLIEKAYLIGFRLGDLGVRKIYPNSKTICVASGSTIKEQIDLIKGLFERYGKVWIQKTKDNKINIQTNLNESFSFLLSKEFPKWVSNNKETFFSFLAGFSDAEGCISKSNKLDYYSLSVCDDSILNIIKNNLNKFGIKCKKLYFNKRKGKQTFEKYKFNHDYWSLRIYDKNNLLKLLTELKPYTKHKNKVKALNIAIDSINMRNKKYGKK